MAGLKIPFNSLPTQKHPPFPFKAFTPERLIITQEVNKLLIKGVVTVTQHSNDEFLSNVFLRPKPNGEHRMILDLTLLNDYVIYKHFKMFSLNTAKDLVSEGHWMASVDLKDAYYSVPIWPPHRKYLRFKWNDVLYEFTCLPNGLACCPRVFTRLLKPIFSEMSLKGHTMFPYIDDSFIVAPSKMACATAVTDLCNIFECLGFTVHPQKSVLVPSTKLKFLGFFIDTIAMHIAITNDKIEKFHTIAQQVLFPSKRLKIRQIAVMVGTMIAYSPAILYGGAHIKSLEIDKNLALARCHGNYERHMSLSVEGRADTLWWLNHIQSSPNPIRISEPNSVITTDASLEGWGAHDDSVATGGRWLDSESDNHINVLELQAILLGIKSLVCKNKTHVRILTDNTTAMAYIRNMGGTKSKPCNKLSKLIWNWAEDNNIWLTVAHIPGSQNTLADKMSRKFNDHLEWSLTDKIFNKITNVWGLPDIDLFASRRNFKISTFVSWHPEPEAWKVDAFSFKWNNNFYYIFPPFSIIARVVRKIQVDHAKAILVIPAWTTQPWYAATQAAASQHINFPRGRNLKHQGPLAAGGDVSTTPLSAFLFSGIT